MDAGGSGAESWGECRLPAVYQTCRDQDAVLSVEGNVQSLQRAGGMNRPMSQTVLKHGCTACQSIREVVSTRGRSREMLRGWACEARRWSTTEHVRVAAGVKGDCSSSRRRGRQVYGREQQTTACCSRQARSRRQARIGRCHCERWWGFVECFSTAMLPLRRQGAASPDWARTSTRKRMQ